MDKWIYHNACDLPIELCTCFEAGISVTKCDDCAGEGTIRDRNMHEWTCNYCYGYGELYQEIPKENK